MKVFYEEDKLKTDSNSIVRYHIWPGGIITGFLVPVCECYLKKNNGYDYCEYCGLAIPTEKEKNYLINIKVNE